MPVPQLTISQWKRPALLPPSWMLWLMRGLALAGFSLASYLTWVSLTGGSLAGACSATGSDCDAVLSSEWSKWFNLPISLGGVAVYGGIFLASWLLSLSRNHEGRLFAWGAIGCLSMLAALSGIWFVILQVQIGKFCLFCLLTHICGILIATIAWFSMPKRLSASGPPRAHVFGTRPPSPSRASQPTGLQASHLSAVALMTLLGMVSLVTGQIMSDHHIQEELVFAGETTAGESSPAAELLASAESIESEPESDESGTRTEVLKPVLPANRIIRFFPGKSAMDVDALPVYARQGAQPKHFILKVMSYTCPGCRKAHQQLHDALEQLGSDEFAVVIRPVALNPKCNPIVTHKNEIHEHCCEYTRLALAVWHADPTKFNFIHEFLMADAETMPSLEEAKQFAADLIGVPALKKLVHDPAVKEMMNENHKLMRFHATQLPTMVFGKTKIQGKTKSASVLAEIIDAEIHGVRDPRDSDLPTG